MKRDINNIGFQVSFFYNHTQKKEKPKIHWEGLSSIKCGTSIQEILGSPQNWCIGEVGVSGLT